MVAPPGVGDVAKIGMGTTDRVRRWTSHGWRLMGSWRTANPDQSYEIEQTVLRGLRETGALDTPRLRELRRGFSGFDGVTEWFDTRVAHVAITVTGDGYVVEIGTP
jgi:hypothetical protein